MHCLELGVVMRRRRGNWNGLAAGERTASRSLIELAAVGIVAFGSFLLIALSSQDISTRQQPVSADGDIVPVHIIASNGS